MVKIRLARRGRKKLALYDVVVANVTAPRDGRFIEKIGTYNPNTVPATIHLNEESALKWLMNGAQPTDTTRAILSYKGVMYKKHLQVGVNKGAITQEAADEKYAAWKDGKESKITGRVDNLANDKAGAAKARLAAETKVNEARVSAQKAKIAAEIAAANPEPVAAVEETIVAEEAPVEAAAPEMEVPAVAVVEEVAAPVEEAPVESAVEEIAAPEVETPAAVAEEVAAPVEEAPAEAVVATEEAPAAEAPISEEAKSESEA